MIANILMELIKWLLQETDTINFENQISKVPPLWKIENNNNLCKISYDVFIYKNPQMQFIIVCSILRFHRNEMVSMRHDQNACQLKTLVAMQLTWGIPISKW